ncbi:MAG: YciC family protein [Candidatus Pacebacteria bacterium]|nr:YciC family protein [Candidatus Paceibacterota bacterium]
MKTFSIKEALGYGWDTTINNIGLVIGMSVFVLALKILSSIVQRMSNFVSLPYVVAFSFCSILLAIISILVSIGFIKIFLRIYDGEKPKFREIFNYQNLFWKFIAGSIIYAFVVAVGTVFLIIPGIIFAIAFAFTTIVIVDKNLGPIKAMKESARVTKGVRWKLLGFGLLLILINIGGAIAFGIGTIITMPLSLFGAIFVYRHLASQ